MFYFDSTVMKFILSIVRYYKVYKNREKEIKREQKNIVYCFSSVFFTLQYKFYL